MDAVVLQHFFCTQLGRCTEPLIQVTLDPQGVARHIADTGVVHTCFFRHRGKTTSDTGGHHRYLTSDIGRRWFRRRKTFDFREHQLTVDEWLDCRRLIGTGRNVGNAERDAGLHIGERNRVAVYASDDAIQQLLSV